MKKVRSSKAGRSEPNEPVGESAIQQEDVRLSVRHALRAEFADDGDAAGQGPKRRKTACPKDQERQANLEFLIAFHWACCKTNGWGVEALMPTRRVGALPRGARRHYVTIADACTGEDRRRAMIRSEGTKYWEVPQVVVDDQRYRPTGHFFVDMGSASWHAFGCLVHGAGARGTRTWDVLHRICNDILDATAAVGCTVIRLEVAAAMSMRRKPYGKWKSLSSAGCSRPILRRSRPGQ